MDRSHCSFVWSNSWFQIKKVSVSPLHAKWSVACVAWWFKQFERERAKPQKRKQNAARFFCCFVAPSNYLRARQSLCLRWQKLLLTAVAADFRTHWFARVDSILTAENKKIMQGMRVYQTRTPLRYFQIDPTASRYVVARNEKSYSKYQKLPKSFRSTCGKP